MANPTPQTDNNWNFPWPMPGKAITVTGSGNAVIRSADGSLWDSVANAWVTPEQTNIGVNQ